MSMSGCAYRIGRMFTYWSRLSGRLRVKLCISTTPTMVVVNSDNAKRTQCRIQREVEISLRGKLSAARQPLLVKLGTTTTILLQRLPAPCQV